MDLKSMTLKEMQEYMESIGEKKFPCQTDIRMVSQTSCTVS